MTASPSLGNAQPHAAVLTLSLSHFLTFSLARSLLRRAPIYERNHGRSPYSRSPRNSVELPSAVCSRFRAR